MTNDTTSADLEIRLPVDALAPRRARSALAAIEPLIPESLVEDLRLLVSEVVTNSVRHAGMCAEDEITLWVTVLADRVLVEAWDSGPGYETSSREPGQEASVPGLGLFLVDLLAKRWGAESGVRCHTWFELDLGRG
jgi:anti-sigma regulatory factor (Ser/Thr protein kinase)